MPPDPNMTEQAMMMGLTPPPPQRVPSVEPDFDADNHMMAADIDRRWLVSDAGRLCKLENPLGYENVLLHMKAHKDMNMQMQMQQMMQSGGMPPQPGGGAPPPAPPGASTGQPLNEGQNEPVAQ